MIKILIWGCIRLCTLHKIENVITNHNKSFSQLTYIEKNNNNNNNNKTYQS